MLVNNAGILREAPLGETALETWNEVIAVNLTGTFLGCREMLPLLKKGHAPAILNLGSVDALRQSSPQRICRQQGSARWRSNWLATGSASLPYVPAPSIFRWSRIFWRKGQPAAGCSVPL